MKSRVLLRGLFICAVLLLPAEMVLACQCRYRESVLDAYERYDAVLVARIQGLEPYPEAATAQPHPLAGLLQAVAVVEKVYKGNVSAGDEIRLQIGNGANWLKFVEGISRDESSATSLVFTLPPGKQVSLDIAFETKKAAP